MGSYKILRCPAWHHQHSNASSKYSGLKCFTVSDLDKMSLLRLFIFHLKCNATEAVTGEIFHFGID